MLIKLNIYSTTKNKIKEYYYKYIICRKKALFVANNGNTKSYFRRWYDAYAPEWMRMEATSLWHQPIACNEG